MRTLQLQVAGRCANKSVVRGPQCAEVCGVVAIQYCAGHAGGAGCSGSLVGFGSCVFEGFGSLVGFGSCVLVGFGSFVGLVAVAVGVDAGTEGADAGADGADEGVDTGADGADVGTETGADGVDAVAVGVDEGTDGVVAGEDVSFKLAASALTRLLPLALKPSKSVM